MDTLYDLLGALPHDDAEDLRAAFRRAVKGTHPDLRPGDPDAALKFRQIVRANEILGDAEQRAAYDHLMVLARVEQQSASRQRTAARIHSYASNVIALTAASIVVVGCLLFMHMPAASLDPASKIAAALRGPPDIEAVSRADFRYPADENSSPAKPESAHATDEAVVPKAMRLSDAESVPTLTTGAAPDPAPNDATSFRARGISAYRNGDLHGAVANLDHAIQLDPNVPASYIDRGIIFYRLQKFDRALADIARAKRIEQQSHPKSTPAMARRPRLEQTGSPPSVTPRPPRRTARKDLVPEQRPEQWYASATGS
jgi:tetratricopeptide (TPR) repeat protein